MIISNSQKFVFVKTNKTAGSSIEGLLSSCLQSDDLVTRLPSDEEPIRLKFVASGSLKYLKGFHSHAPLSQAHQSYPESRDYFSFGFIRNPFQRAISLFRWRNAKKIARLIEEHSDGGDAQVLQIKLQRSFFKFMDSQGSQLLIERGKDLLQSRSDSLTWSVNRIFRLEDLESAITEIQTAVGVEIDFSKMPKFKSSVIRIPKGIDLWMDETVALILERHRWEFDEFSYPSSPYTLS